MPVFKHVVMVFKKKLETDIGRSTGTIGKDKVYVYDPIAITYEFHGWEKSWFDKDVIAGIGGKNSTQEVIDNSHMPIGEEDTLAFMFSPESEEYFVEEGVTTLSNGEHDLEIEQVLKNKKNYSALFKQKEE
jgi:hypothetical protein